MKQKNFPGRINDRRISALERLTESDTVLKPVSGLHAFIALNRTIVTGNTKRFTKKNRADRAKDKK
jgi:hypothetical protein